MWKSSSLPPISAPAPVSRRGERCRGARKQALAAEVPPSRSIPLPSGRQHSREGGGQLRRSGSRDAGACAGQAGPGRAGAVSSHPAGGADGLRPWAGTAGLGGAAPPGHSALTGLARPFRSSLLPPLPSSNSWSGGLVKESAPILVQGSPLRCSLTLCSQKSRDPSLVFKPAGLFGALVTRSGALPAKGTAGRACGQSLLATRLPPLLTPPAAPAGGPQMPPPTAGGVCGWSLTSGHHSPPPLLPTRLPQPAGPRHTPQPAGERGVHGLGQGGAGQVVLESGGVGTLFVHLVQASLCQCQE